MPDLYIAAGIPSFRVFEAKMTFSGVVYPAAIWVKIRKQFWILRSTAIFFNQLS